VSLYANNPTAVKPRCPTEHTLHPRADRRSRQGTGSASKVRRRLSTRAPGGAGSAYRTPSVMTQHVDYADAEASSTTRSRRRPYDSAVTRCHADVATHLCRRCKEVGGQPDYALGTCTRSPDTATLSSRRPGPASSPPYSSGRRPTSIASVSAAQKLVPTLEGRRGKRLYQQSLVPRTPARSRLRAAPLRGQDHGIHQDCPAEFHRAGQGAGRV